LAFQDPPVQTPIVNQQGQINNVWVNWFRDLYNITGGAEAIDLTGLTASVAELNTLDGITATTGDLNATNNFEDTVSSTAAQFNVATTKTFNVVDVGAFEIADTAVTATAAELNIIDGVTASTADLNATTNFEETISATTSEVTIATTKTLNIADDSAFKLNEVAVTSTAAELNVLDGITTTTDELNQNDLTGSVGTVAGTNITVAEQGNVVIHKSVFTLTAHPITITDSGANGGHGTTEFYTFPEGHTKIIGGHMNLTVFSAQGTGSADAGETDIGVGSVPVSTGDETLSGTEQDIVTKLDVTLDGSGDLPAAVSSINSTDVTFDGSATATTANFNVAIEAATISANETFDVTGTITLSWILLGDN